MRYFTTAKAERFGVCRSSVEVYETHPEFAALLADGYIEADALAVDATVTKPPVDGAMRKRKV